MPTLSALAISLAAWLPLAAGADVLHCSGSPATPGQLALQLGKSTLMRLPEPVQQRSVGNPAIMQAMLVAADTLYLVGVDVGSTNLIVQGRSGACSVVEVTVSMDVGPLRASLAALFPDEKDVRVTGAADALVLSGSVSDAPTLAQVLELAQAYVRRPLQPLSTREGEGAGARPLAPNANATPGAMTGAPAAGAARLVNLLSVSAPQQVMLEVKVAEVSKTLLERLEAGLNLTHVGGSWTATLLSNFLSGTAHGMLDFSKTNGSKLTLDAEKQDGQVRILAEPTVLAISGQEGTFLAGGKILVPVAQDNNRVTLEEKEFGVGLRFTPTVLAGGRINLRVAPEVSELSRDGVGISSGGFGGRTVLPLITSRRASTTVQLQDGQSFAIGGLIRNNQVANVKGLPFLADIPVLGALFRSTDFQSDRSELLFVITAHLVKPLTQPVALPTDTPPRPAAGGQP